MKPLTRILIVYSSKPPIIDYLASAFQRVGIVTDRLYADQNTWFDKWVIRRINKQLHNLKVLPKNRDLFAHHPLAHKNFRSANLAQKVVEFKPDLVFLIRGISFNTDTLEGISPLFGWWIEKEERVEEALREIGLFDWYFFMNRSCVDIAEQRGHHNVSYLGHAVDPEVFRPIPGSEKRFDLCFVGNWSPKRQEFIEAALRVTPNIAVYGGKWIKKNLTRPSVLRCIKGRYIEGEELTRLYNQSKVVLNVTNWGKGEGAKRSGMNMRVMEVPATGAFLLTDGSRELEDFLSPGHHIAVYEGKSEFLSQLEYYLGHDAAREEIAQCGMAHVCRHYSYDTVVQSIIQAFGNLPLQSLQQDNQGICDAQFNS